MPVGSLAFFCVFSAWWCYFYSRAAARGQGGLKVFFVVLGYCCSKVAQFSVFSFQAHFPNFRRALLCCKVAKFPAFRFQAQFSNFRCLYFEFRKRPLCARSKSGVIWRLVP